MTDDYNANIGNELPTRGLVNCAVFEELEDGAELRDLECLDCEEPPRIVVIGRLVKLSEEGMPLQSSQVPAESEAVIPVSDVSAKSGDLACA